MNIACFRIHLVQTKRLLDKIGLLRDSNIDTGFFEPSEDTKKAGHGVDYYALYRSVEKNYDYEFSLTDGSFFQFAFLENGLRYAFLESISEFMTFEEYLLEEGVTGEEVGVMDESVYSMYRECYDAEIDSMKQKMHPLYIRYDYTNKPEEHVPNVHSSSHFHFGWHNMSRIPCAKILTPEAFTCFALKMYSPSKWKDLLEKEIITDADYTFKKYTEELPNTLWEQKEERDIYMN